MDQTNTARPGPLAIDPTTIVVATRNAGKVAELRTLLADSPLTCCGLDEVETALGRAIPEPAEDHTPSGTFLGNATAKATAYADATGMRCLADDSGLEVDALDGSPGVISSHYAWDGRTEGEPASLDRAGRDAQNIGRLLREMQGIPAERRTARFVCQMVLAQPGGAGERVLATTRGTFEGRIGLPPDVPRGSNGFGYDPVFLVGPDFGRTSAELAPEAKNRLSHRGAAARAMLDKLCPSSEHA